VKPEESTFPAWVRHGIDLCRQGKWQEGLPLLIRAAESTDDPQRTKLPPRFYSYLGYGLARHKGKHREGLELCEHAVRVEFYQVENLINLARAYQVVGDKTRSIATVRRGLKLDPENRDLRKLIVELGERRPPVLKFLARGNALNVFLGRIRHGLKGKAS
jgi:tetratricopeptide (TPR) repeat protein